MLPSFYGKEMMSASEDLNVFFPHEYFIHVDKNGKKIDVSEDFFIKHLAKGPPSRGRTPTEGCPA